MKHFDGKSDAMEVEAALMLCQRSEAQYFQFTDFIREGDWSTFNAMWDLKSEAGP